MLNPLFLYHQIEKEKEKEREIQKRAEVLANQIVEDRKKVEESIYGKNKKLDLFQKQKEEEEKRKYQEAIIPITN